MHFRSCNNLRHLVREVFVVRSGPLRTAQSRDGDTVTLTCTGSAETEAAPELAQALDGVHSDALAGSTRSVVADLRGLEFASSSCLKQLVSWLKRVQQLDAPQRYKVVFRSNPAHSWQRRSLGALADFASEFVEIREAV